MIDIVEGIAGIEVKRNHDLSAPQGVRGPQLGQHDDPGAARLGAISLAR